MNDCIYTISFPMPVCPGTGIQGVPVPADKVPAIDGNTDWDCVPADYKITEQL